MRDNQQAPAPDRHHITKKLSSTFAKAVIKLASGSSDINPARISNIVKLAKLLRIMSTVDFVSTESGERTTWEAEDMERVVGIIGLALEGKDVPAVDLIWVNRYIQHCNIHLGRLVGIPSKSEESEDACAPAATQQPLNARSRRSRKS